MATGQAAGVALVLAAKSGVPVALHTPSEVKAAVSGSGRADKKQVALMVTKILGLASAPKPVDTTDALALAICHHWRGNSSKRIANAAAKERTRLKALRKSQ
jgi:crossover junction endodeoxyribonuclease RuvC